MGLRDRAQFFVYFIVSWPWVMGRKESKVGSSESSARDSEEGEMLETGQKANGFSQVPFSQLFQPFLRWKLIKKEQRETSFIVDFRFQSFFLWKLLMKYNSLLP